MWYNCRLAGLQTLVHGNKPQAVVFFHTFPTPVRGNKLGTTGGSFLPHAKCEAVAAERAGGEGGHFRAVSRLGNEQKTFAKPSAPRAFKAASADADALRAEAANAGRRISRGKGNPRTDVYRPP